MLTGTSDYDEGTLITLITLITIVTIVTSITITIIINNAIIITIIIIICITIIYLCRSQPVEGIRRESPGGNHLNI